MSTVDSATVPLVPISSNDPSHQQRQLTRNPSPSSSTLGSLRNAFSRALSPNREVVGERRTSFSSRMSHLEDGRGRQPIVSTGRGGAGNLFRSPSRGVDQDVTHGLERGREVAPRDQSGDRVTHSGRGGAGNIRSPSRHGPKEALIDAKEEALQARLIAEERGRQQEHGNFSTGRGGVGNISRSKSRSRSQARTSRNESPRPDLAPPIAAAGPNGVAGAHHEVRSGGRGGWGNIQEEHERSSLDEEKLAAQRKHDDEIRAKHLAEEANKPHVMGKGGAGNLVAPGSLAHVDFSKLTLEEKEAYQKVHGTDAGHPVSSGRGGAGNIHAGHSHEDGERGRHQHGGLLNNVIRSLSRATGRGESQERKKEA